MKRSVLDLSVGVFVLIGLLALGWLSINLGRIDWLGGRGYIVTADFPTVSGLKAGSPVEIAGVAVGQVDDARWMLSYLVATQADDGEAAAHGLPPGRSCQPGTSTTAK